MKHFSRRYLFRRWLNRYVHWSDFLGVFIGILGGILAILAYSSHQLATLMIGLIYILLFISRFIYLFRKRKSKDDVQGRIFWNLCRRIDEEVIKSEIGARITFFWRDPSNRKYIVARYRYGRGLDHPIIDANGSRARYRANEGQTGRAWTQPGYLFISKFKKFGTRHQFEEFYIDRVKIDKDTVTDLSDYMVGVRTILSYGLEDSYGRFLGVVSLDLKEAVQTKQLPNNGESKVMAEYSEGERIITFDELRIRDVLRSMQSMLEAFAQSA